MSSIETKIKQLTANIKNITNNKITIVAASKYASTAQIIEAYNAGITDFGENYCQDATLKIKQLQQYNLTWHFIGSIQTNKLKKIGKNFTWIQSITSLKQIQKLCFYYPEKVFNICIQVKVDDSEKRHACLFPQATTLLESIEKYNNINLRGIMYLPPANLSNKDLQKKYYLTQQYYFKIKNRFKLDTLSMGMSTDHNTAIINNANMIRVGKIIFAQ
jgi:pyridoxal phosphate enzyme (YggS family)